MTHSPPPRPKPLGLAPPNPPAAKPLGLATEGPRITWLCGWNLRFDGTWERWYKGPEPEVVGD